MPLLALPLRQAPRILQSSRLLCLNLPCRSGRPYEYFKAPGSYASTYPAAPAGPTNTPKLQVHMPLLALPLRQAIRIPQSSRLLCLNLPCRSGRPHEYPKAPDSYASTQLAAPEGHTNTPKLQTHMPQLTLPLRQATRILQSSRLICLYLPCRFGRPHEYLKAPGSYASTYPAAPEGPTNTSKSLAHMPQLTLSHRQAIRILQSSRLICLNLPCLTRQATRILQSPWLICLNLPCRIGRPYEYSKAPGSYASTYPAASAGQLPFC